MSAIAWPWVIKRPLVSEKSMMLLEKQNVVQFIVDKRATKPDIKKCIESLFDVKVRSVRVANFLGKAKKFKSQLGKRSDYKKAYVQLLAGEKISLFEQQG